MMEMNRPPPCKLGQVQEEKQQIYLELPKLATMGIVFSVPLINHAINAKQFRLTFGSISCHYVSIKG